MKSIGLFGINFGTASAYVIGYGTASGTGLINNLTISSSPTASVAVAASPPLNNRFGFCTLFGVNNYSYGASYSGSTKTAIKANIDWQVYNKTTNYSGRVLADVNSLWLTNAPNTQYIGENEYATLTYYNPSFATVSVAIIDDLGTVYAANNSKQGLVTLGVGTANYNTFNTGAKSYEVRIVSSETPTYLIETRNYIIDCRKRPDAIRLMWANRWGGVDYYTFNYITSVRVDAKRSDFDRNLIYGYTNNDRGITSYKIEDFKSYSVESDLLSEADSEWLAEILSSKEVYMVDGTTYLPISITNNSVQLSTGWENYSLRFDFRLARTNRY